MPTVRKIYRSRGTFMIGIPKPMIDRIGGKRGTTMVLTQPFSSSIILTGVHAGGEGAIGEQTRSIGWLVGQVRPERDLAPLGVWPLGRELPCMICNRWKAIRLIGMAPLCTFCCTELSHAVWLRSSPAQGELTLQQASLMDGGLVADQRPIASHEDMNEATRQFQEMRETTYGTSAT